MKKNDIKLIISSPGNKVLIECNDVKISQIVLNLINNARDAICSSEVKEKWIKVIIEDHLDEIKIKVIDSGPGVPTHLKCKVLDPFFTTKILGKDRVLASLL